MVEESSHYDVFSSEFNPTFHQNEESSDDAIEKDEFFDGPSVPLPTPEYQEEVGESCTEAIQTVSEHLALQSHIYCSHTYTRERKVLCPQCGKKFLSNSSLKKHLMRDDHTIDGESQKPYKCEYCQKAFKKRSDREYHINIHTGVVKESLFTIKE